VQTIQIDSGRLVAIGVKCDLRAVGQRTRVAGARLGQRREVARGAGVRAADAGAARKPETGASRTGIENHPARRSGDLLEPLQRPAVAQRARRLIEHGGRAAIRESRGSTAAVINHLHRVRVAAGGERRGVGRLEGDLLDVARPARAGTRSNKRSRLPGKIKKRVLGLESSHVLC
jgi:hypothetical protein